jgi:very-short-patch-repair endonuclease
MTHNDARRPCEREAGTVMRRGDAQRCVNAGGDDPCIVVHPDRALARLATLQDGVAGRAQLLVAGLTRDAIRRRVESGALVPLFRGTYAIGRTTVTARGWARSALLSVGDDAAASHRTAAHVSDWCEPPDEVHISVPRRLRPRPGLVIHHVMPFAPGDITHKDGLRLTSPLRTLQDLRNDPGFDRLAAEAHVQGDVTREQIERIAPPDSPAPTRSALERAMNRIVTAARLPRPLTGHHIAGHECDFVWPEERVIVETDGYRTHGHRWRFETDRERDAAHAALGYVVLRFTYRQLTEEPLLVAARLAQVLTVRAKPPPG